MIPYWRKQKTVDICIISLSRLEDALSSPREPLSPMQLTATLPLPRPTIGATTPQAPRSRNGPSRSRSHKAPDAATRRRSLPYSRNA